MSSYCNGRDDRSLVEFDIIQDHTEHHCDQSKCHFYLKYILFAINVFGDFIALLEHSNLLFKWSSETVKGTDHGLMVKNKIQRWHSPYLGFILMHRYSYHRILL